jgi:hypothetical protein
MALLDRARSDIVPPEMMDLTLSQARTLILACVTVLDTLRDRREISDREWMRHAELLSVRAAVWLLHARDGTTGAGVP